MLTVDSGVKAEKDNERSTTEQSKHHSNNDPALHSWFKRNEKEKEKERKEFLGKGVRPNFKLKLVLPADTYGITCNAC